MGMTAADVFFSPDGRMVGFYTTQTRVRSPSLCPRERSGRDAPRPPTGSLGEGTWSWDGRWLVYREGATPNADLMAVRTDGDTTPEALVATSYNERSPTLSPDGRWLAYASDESGINEIYVRPFPETAQAKRQVSLTAATACGPTADGNCSTAMRPVAAEITTAPAFAVGSQTGAVPRRRLRHGRLP